MRNILLFLSVISSTAFCQFPNGDDIVMKIDKNYRSNSKIIVSKMIIHGRRGSRTIESKTWIEGTDKSFTEYLSPPREKGIKMLKLGDELWTYMPSTDRTIRISGHMLRQSAMGSDLSYEDMMEDPELHRLYEAEVIAEDTLLGRPCWVLELRAKQDNIAYYRLKVWVDKERNNLLKEARYARSDKILKTTDIKDVFQVQNRWMGKRIVYKDVMKKGKGTEFVVESIEFDSPIPEHVFSKAALRK